jgi:hypothetical protein
LKKHIIFFFFLSFLVNKEKGKKKIKNDPRGKHNQAQIYIYIIGKKKINFPKTNNKKKEEF